MFERKEFIRSLSCLGDKMLKSPENFAEAFAKASADNPFFTPFMMETAFRRIAEKYLSEDALERLLSYSDSNGEDKNLYRKQMEGKTVGIIMAGNIPAVGFHDLLCTLSTGARSSVKLSSKDRFLIPAIVEQLEKISPYLASRISFEDRAFLRDNAGKLDFLLFAGADSTKALLKEEFPGIPMLARGSRFSLGVLDGGESDEDLARLAEDMFLYCGMGCRSVSYLLIPKGFDIGRIVAASACMKERLEGIAPYRNGYLRQRAIDIMEGLPFIDGGFFVMEKSESPFPPLGCVRYAFYGNSDEIDSFCSLHRDEIQKKYTNFGMAQSPDTDDWMDGINTVWSILKK
jgi:hypothetical protein